MVDEHWVTRIYWADLPVDNQAVADAMYCLKGERNYGGGYTTYYDVQQLHLQPPFDVLMEQIMKHAHEFMPPAKGTLRPGRSWCSIMPTGGAHPAHAHPGSYLSGTYYPKTLGRIIFHDPRVGAITSSVTPDPLINYPAVAGRVILFPSWLIHEVPANDSAEERLSFSFNIHNDREPI